MTQREEISGRFIKTILEEEWNEFESIQTSLITEHTKRFTGRLLLGRRFSTTGGQGFYAEAHLQHPVHERFVDIKKLKFMGRGYGDKDRLTSRRRKPIHNSLLFSKLNTIAYRINWELADEVLKSNVPAGYDVNIRLAGPYRG
ncbi:MAG: hypothetical protein EHM12_08025 [Dehalococcoidia bacterium]|nr:MAG: hypothetical protein EHM12_08025 [Dehalococcoidia bacterium]